MIIINKRIYTVLAILWMAFIFYMSNQPAAVSSQQSGGVIEFIKAMPIIGNIMTYMMEIEIGEFIIRKSAHMFLYFVLAMFIFMSMYDVNKEIKTVAIISFIFTVLYACTDEIHQLFIPGRSGELRDVLVDSTGAIIGTTLIYYILKYNKYKKIEEYKSK
ncbi:MAG: VanZ family protein [Peptostreptococcaceae bacterium]